MASYTKIATCNYCHTRAALVLKGKERHELACSACGAPLHDLKVMPSAASSKRKRHEDHAYGISHKPAPKDAHPPKYKKKSKKKKSRMKGFFSEAFDLIEDIFD